MKANFLKNILLTLTLFSLLPAKAQHELGMSFGRQKCDYQPYGIAARNMVSFSYRFIKNRASFLTKGNYGFASTTQTLPFGSKGQNIEYRTVTLKTSISTIGVGFTYDILHKPKNKVCLGTELGAVILSDQYNITNAREQMGLFLQYTREKVFNKHLAVQMRLERNLLGKAPLILDASPAFYSTSSLLSFNIGLAYKIGSK